MGRPTLTWESTGNVSRRQRAGGTLDHRARCSPSWRARFCASAPGSGLEEEEEESVGGGGDGRREGRRQIGWMKG
eukprot:2450542-Rhodomonas_salina.2